MHAREDVVKLLLTKRGVDPFSTGGVSILLKPPPSTVFLNNNNPLNGKSFFEMTLKTLFKSRQNHKLNFLLFQLLCLIVNWRKSWHDNLVCGFLTPVHYCVVIFRVAIRRLYIWWHPDKLAQPQQF